MKEKWFNIPKRLNFIQIALLLGLINWIAEAFREAVVFGKGSLVKCIITPSSESLWMRLIVGGILLFFGTIVQSLRERS